MWMHQNFQIHIRYKLCQIYPNSKTRIAISNLPTFFCGLVETTQFFP